VSWEHDNPANAFVRYLVGEDPWQETPAQERDAGSQEQIVLGIPYESDFQFRVVATADGVEHLGDFVAGTTGVIPETMLAPELYLSDETAHDPADRYLFGSLAAELGRWVPDGGFWSFIVDRRGRLVWARLTPHLHVTMYVRVSTSGRDFLVDDNTFWFNFEALESRVHRIKIDGSIVQTYDTPGLHHPYTELPDGTIVWGATQPPDGESIEELAPDGSRRTVWDSREFFDGYELAAEVERFQSNALFWDELSNSYFFSSYWNFYLVQIARENGATLQIFGGHLPSSWRVTPPDAAFYWQHGVTVTPDRTLLMSMHESDSSFEGVVREYHLDESLKTLQQVWTWGDGNGIEPIFAGEAHRLANGDTLINYGTTPVVREVSPEGLIVWEIRWPEERFIGRTVFVEDLYAFVP
jgi:hypothetical protein